MSRACLWSMYLCLALSSCASGVRAGRHLQRREDEDGAWSESVARARCASRCLGLYRGYTSGTQNNVSLEWCQSSKQCAMCLEPCKASWVMKKRSSCDQMCQTTFPMMPWECVGSCDFLVSALSLKQGQCPGPDRAQGFEAACVQSCTRDQDCPKTRKCCSNGCGQTCQTPDQVYKGVPVKPRKELWFREESSGELEVGWSCRFSISVEPVVYVLQRRWNYGIQPSEDSATTWEDVAQTSSPWLMTWLRPGRWYQFRVAAVNSQGSRGFTAPSKHVHSSTEPSPPPPPSHLRVSDLSFGLGRSASAQIIWDPAVNTPVDPDQDWDQDQDQDQQIPVQVYLVSWSWTSEEPKPGTKPRPAEKKKRKTVRKPSLSLSSLRQNRTYSVEVQAVSFWRQNLLKSKKSTIQFSTHTLGPPSARLSQSDSFLNVGTPFYQDGELRVYLYWKKDPSEFYKVQWSPEHCSHNLTKEMQKTVTEESFVSLPGLLFSCKYRVVLQRVQTKTGSKSKSEFESWSGSKSKSETKTFLTPSCSMVQAKSVKPINCTEQTGPSLKKDQQQQPISKKY
ncbi:anosmin-1a [Periophthalmus magnuspinnatus]|uniref:anosmin-1a n=1 Tax=Periophthalmus magnuspinnatus TaxID=409849 RepID=UPI002436DD1D|nr:anosmin-1a [Periophthalmus magnuspinnatus]